MVPLGVGLATRAVFDTLSGDVQTGWNVWTLLTLWAIIGLSRSGIFMYAIQVYRSYYLMVQALLRSNMLDYLMQAHGTRVLPTSPSEAVTQFRDDVDDITQYVESWMDLGGFIIYGISALVLLFRIDPWITVIVCIPLCLIAVLMHRMGPVIRRFRRAFREATEHVTGLIGETFASVQAVKVAGKEAPVTERFAVLGEARRRAALRDTLLTELIQSLNTGLVNVGIGVVLILAAGQMRTGQFTVGDFALFVHVLPRLTRVLNAIGGTMTLHKRSRVSFDRLLHLLQDAPPQRLVMHRPLHLEGELPDPAASPPVHHPLQVLEVRGLSFRYPGSEAGIHDISFKMRRGEFVVVTGRIGSGKTTLLRVLQGLIPAEGGEVLWNGRRVADLATFFRPPHSAYTAQVPRLFSETLKQNVLMGEGREARIDQALDLAVMGPDVEAMEKGLDTLVGTRGVKLSGGQVQRTAAARMFVREADLLIFDDLSSALDVQTERHLWSSLFQTREVTCLVVSHRRAALARADRIIVLGHGRVVAQGTFLELQAGGHLDWLHGAQAEQTGGSSS